MLEGARIITLVDPVESGGAVTFEEAFGEQSELKGRGRARRQARRQTRRMTRIENRKTRKLAKQEMRQERLNRRAEAKANRKAMKSQAQREEAMADAENEQAVEALQPQEDESTGYDQQPEESEEEQAPEELDQNSEAEETESEFEAGSISEYTSSFDSESSDASGARFKKPGMNKINWHKKSIGFHNAKIAAVKKQLATGKLPSNEVARHAKLIRELESKVQRSKERLTELNKQGLNNRFTKVGSNLNAKIEPNRIEVPANSSAEGDEYLGFDAKETIKKNKNVLIGVGVAAAVIVGLHLAGVFKK